MTINDTYTLDAMEARLRAEETEGWQTPANRTTREYAARQALRAVSELRYRIAEFNEAVNEEAVQAGRPLTDD